MHIGMLVHAKVYFIPIAQSVLSFSSYYQRIHLEIFLVFNSSILIVYFILCILKRYCIRVYDEKVEIPWEHMSSFKYYIDLIMEMISYALNGLHHLHMLYFTEHWFSVATFIIFLQVL